MKKISMTYVYLKVKEITQLAFKDDDLMTQETLFEAQDKLATLLLEVAQNCGKEELNDLVKSFPYLYKKGGQA